mgnify:CR=1 FL=1
MGTACGTRLARTRPAGGQGARGLPPGLLLGQAGRDEGGPPGAGVPWADPDARHLAALLAAAALLIVIALLVVASVAAGLTDRDISSLEWALETARATQPDLDQLSSDLAGGIEITKAIAEVKQAILQRAF